MQNLTIHFDDRPGTLADMGQALGNAGVSVEGGGTFVVDGRGIGQYLFHDGQRARQVLEAAGLRVIAVREVVLLRLRQTEPRQLGTLTRRMAEAGINIEVQYSDHDHQLVLVVDKPEAARAVAARWTAESAQ